MKFFKKTNNNNVTAPLVSVTLSDFLKGLPQNEKHFEPNRIKEEHYRKLLALTPNAKVVLTKTTTEYGYYCHNDYEHYHFNIAGTNHAIVRVYRPAYDNGDPRDYEGSIENYEFKRDSIKDEEIIATVEDFCEAFDFSKEMITVLRKDTEFCRLFFGMREDLKYLNLVSEDVSSALGLKFFVPIIQFAMAKTKNALVIAIKNTVETWLSNEKYVSSMYDFFYPHSVGEKFAKFLSNCSLSELKILSQFIVDAISDTSELYINTELHDKIREEVIAFNEEKRAKNEMCYIANQCKISNNFAAEIKTRKSVSVFFELIKFCKEFLANETEETAKSRGFLTGSNASEKVRILKQIVDCFKQKSESDLGNIPTALENEEFCTEFAKKLF